MSRGRDFAKPLSSLIRHVFMMVLNAIKDMLLEKERKKRWINHDGNTIDLGYQGTGVGKDIKSRD